MSVNIILIAIISIISIIAFNRPEIMARFQLNAWSVFNRKEYVRMISHGFLHADWSHLLINMFVLFSFGHAVLFYFEYFFTTFTEIRFLILFLTAIPVSAIYSAIKNKSNHWYNAVGASGGVSAIVFASIFFDPYNPILLFAIIPIPGIIFGILYLYYSARMARQQSDNIGHDAHFWGAVYGFVFPLFYDPSLILHFFEQIMTFKVFG